MSKDLMTPKLALMRLAVATREVLDAGVYDVYLEDLAGFPEDVIIDACARLRTTADWFPKVKELIAVCNDVQAEQVRHEKLARLAPMPPALPMTPEEREAKQRAGEEMRDKFLAELRQIARKKVMR